MKQSLEDDLKRLKNAKKEIENLETYSKNSKIDLLGGIEFEITFTKKKLKKYGKRSSKGVQKLRTEKEA